MSLGWLRQVILRESASISEQEAALVRAAVAVFGVALAVSLGAVAAAGHPGLFAVVMACLVVAAILVLGLVAYVSYTTLRDSALRPIDELTVIARQLSGGDLSNPPQPSGAPEMRQIATTVGNLATALAAEKNRRVADRRAGDRENSSLRQILSITGDVGGRLEREPILVQLANGAKRLGGYSDVAVWGYDELDSELVPMYPFVAAGDDSEGPARVKVSSVAVGRAATSGQTVRLKSEDDRAGGIAVPLVVGLHVLGVIELRGEDRSEAIATNPLDALEALAAHAATALAAAALYEQLEQRSETDGLTRVFNRRKLDADLKSEVARSLRYGHPLTLIMLDVDHFKLINDSFGHQTGDEVLKLVALALARGRGTDSAYRFGGEEFAILLRETDLIAARAVAERLRLKVKESVAVLELEREVTASLGIAAISTEIQTAEKLVEAADEALYEAKQSGRNQVVVCRQLREQPGSAKS